MTRNWLYIVLVLLFGFTLVGVSILKNGIDQTNESIEKFETYFLNEYKKNIQLVVENHIAEIEFELNNITYHEKQIIKNKVQQLSYLLTEQQVYWDTTDDVTMKVIEKIVAFDQAYLYFVLTSDGTLLRSGNNDALEGINLYNVHDDLGRYFVRDMVKAIDQPEGIYVSYRWPKIANGPDYEKTSYCLYLEEFDLIIGTGFYHTDIHEKLKEQIFESLLDFYKYQENHIFINDYDGTVRVDNNPNLAGKKKAILHSLAGDNIHEIYSDIALNEGQGFFMYQYMDQNQQISERLSYVSAIDNWDSYIGMDFNTDELRKEINNYSISFKQKHYTEVVKIIIILVLIGLVVFVLIQRGLLIQMRYIKQEEVIFSQLFQYAHEAIIILSHKGHVLYQNKLAKHMFGGKLNRYIQGKHLLLDVDSDNIQVLKNEAGRNFYVESKSEEILYHGNECSIYFITDMTKSYLDKHRFEQMALLDDLTQLPNRRKLKNDFEDMCYAKSMVPSVLAMIDLDNFKIINDTHGHSVGDQVIIILGNTFTTRLRHSDAFYRYGGEEFVVLLNDTNLTLAKDILRDIDDIFSIYVDQQLGFPVTFSGGIVEIDWQSENCNLERFLEEADGLLYQAKESGRNKIMY